MDDLLFSVSYPENNEPPEEDVNITTTILYFSEKQLRRFKELCKRGILRRYGSGELDSKGNLPTLLLELLEELYGK